MRSVQVIASVLCCLPTVLCGQQSFAVPQSPAFTYLDLSPTRIERPTTARDVGIGLMNGIDAQGRVRQGLAAEATPWPWIPGLAIPASSYGNVGKYMLANLALSFGSARAAGDTAATDLAFGARTTVVDRSDPMADRAFRDSLRAAAVACNSDDPDAADSAIRTCIATRNAQLRAQWLKTRWNAASFSLAAASGVRLRQSRFDQGNFTGVSAWAALALPLTTRGQLMAQARFDYLASIGRTPAASALRTGARAVFGSALVNGFLELEHNGEPAAGADARTSWTGGIEFRATDEMWIATGFGKGYSAQQQDKIVMLANIRWRISSAPRLQPER